MLKQRLINAILGTIKDILGVEEDFAFLYGGDSPSKKEVVRVLERDLCLLLSLLEDEEAPELIPAVYNALVKIYQDDDWATAKRMLSELEKKVKKLA